MHDDDDDDEFDNDGDEFDDDKEVRRFDEVLRLLLEPIRAKAEGECLERIDRCEIDLRRCLDANADRLLIDPELALLRLERALDPEGATGRVASAELVLLLLPIFLSEPEWPGVDVEDRRLRISLAMTLARTGVRLPELADYASGCAMWDVEAAVQRAREGLRRDLEGQGVR
jgi:hypothetical protein